jgi:Uma2 family endonuclease
MAMPAHTLEWTADMARALPDDGRRYEVLDGALFVTPAPAVLHQWVLGQLYMPLRGYVERHRIGRVLWSPADIQFSPRRLVQPDLFVVPWVERPPASWREITQLVLAIEVLSPSTARADREVKRHIYQAEGVPEYWIIDTDARLVDRWRPGDERAEVIAASLVWAPRADIEPLRLSLDELFGPPPAAG